MSILFDLHSNKINLVDIYKTCKLIRLLEEKIASHYPDGQMRSTPIVVKNLFLF